MVKNSLRGNDCGSKLSEALKIEDLQNWDSIVLM